MAIAEIDKKIEEHQRCIDLLNERRRELINQTNANKRTCGKCKTCKCK